MFGRWGVLIGMFLLGMATWPSSVQGQKDDEIVVSGKSKPFSEWVKMLQASDANSRRVGLLAMETVGPKKAGVVSYVIEVLEKDSDPDVRQEVAQLLGRWGAEAKGTVDALATALKSDKSENVREAAARALGGSLAPHASSHVLILGAALKDPHAGTRAAAAETLREMGDKARPALPDVIEALKNTKGDRFTRIYAARVLGRFKEEVEKTAPVLAAVMRDEQAPQGVREACAGAIGQLAADATIADLAKTLVFAKATKEKTPEANPPELRRAAILALAKMAEKAKAAWPAVKKTLDMDNPDPDSSVRLQAVRLAGLWGRVEGEVVLALEDVSAKDTVTENRLAAIQELGELGAVAERAVKTLTTLAEQDSRFAVREAAQAALKKIKGS